jgi:hypothetical protein
MALGWKMRVLGRNMASEAEQLAGDGVHVAKPWQGTERAHGAGDISLKSA